MPAPGIGKAIMFGVESGVTRRLALALPILVAGCVAPREAAPPPPSPVLRPAPPPAPAPTPPPADWRDRDYTPGDWSYSASAGYAEAAYGPVGAPVLTLRCDTSTRQVRLGWAGVPGGGVTVTTSYGDTARQLSADGVLLLPSGDPLLDQIAYSRGRFRVAAQGQELILPAWPEISRVVEECR